MVATVVLLFVVWTAIVGYVYLMTRDDDDARAMREYRRQKAEFDSWFE